MNTLFDQRRYLIPFRSSLLPQIFTDTLVIGAGVAGLSAALSAANSAGRAVNGGATTKGESVIVLTKDDPALSSTAWAQGGIAAVTEQSIRSAGDSVASHIQDTLAAGAGLCDPDVVEHIVKGAGPRIQDLIDAGMGFDQDAGGQLAVGLEAAHAHARILHADGDATGRELFRCLIEQVRATPAIRLFDKCFALDLITPSDDPGAPVMGAITFHPRFGLQMIWARSTILAAGGAGVLFRETSNPRVSTADGIAMAYRAGAAIADMAFVQFHPTALYLAGAARSLITEAVRGEGAFLRDQGGHRFMLDEHPLAELAPRDVVSRAIVKRLATHGGTHVFLDVRHVAGFAARFPGISRLLDRYDLNPGRDLIPVNPAAHYTIGGVRVDLDGRTSIPGLFAVGEVSCSGLHGANRLASNSLLEGLVMGHDAGAAAAQIAAHPIGSPHMAASNGSRTMWKHAAPPAPIPIVSDIRPSEQGDIDLPDILSSLRSCMWRNAGVARSGPRLGDAADMVDFWARYTLDKIFDEPSGWQAQNMLLVAALLVRSGLWRNESRGCHWRSDAPELRDDFRVHDVWRRGVLAPVAVPVSESPGAFV